MKRESAKWSSRLTSGDARPHPSARARLVNIGKKFGFLALWCPVAGIGALFPCC
jgi:hypothetical protein